MIDSFNAENAFLSNFYPARVSFEGVSFPTVEHAFQAAKTLSQYERLRIKAAPSPGQAKRRGNDRSQTQVREDWEEIKVSVMRDLLWQKFIKEPMRTRLLATSPRELVEGNHWGDTFWGVCRGVGQNHLGKLLMEIRAELAQEDQ